MKRLVALVAIASTLVGGCRLLETGYGDENVMVGTTADSASASASALKSSTSWAGAKVQSFGDDLDSDLHALFIYIGDLAAAAYRTRPEIPEGCQPLSTNDFARLALPLMRRSCSPIREVSSVQRTTRQGFQA